MPLIRANAVAAPAWQHEARDLLLAQLAGSDAGLRRHAARALSQDSEAAPALAAQLEMETDRSVRDALFCSLVWIGGTPAARLLARLLRSANAGVRSGAVEALKRLGDEAIPVLDALLDDPDPDKRLLSIEVTRAWPSRLAVPRLQRVLETDPHVNVCVAALDVATEVGNCDLTAAISALPARFPDEPFIVFAADVARARIQTSAGRAS